MRLSGWDPNPERCALATNDHGNSLIALCFPVLEKISGNCDCHLELTEVILMQKYQFLQDLNLRAGLNFAVKLTGKTNPISREKP